MNTQQKGKKEDFISSIKKEEKKVEAVKLKINVRQLK
jgi:hypothetical protein